jgi:GH15 family glucan-1,4-alpha-glucosidase
MYCALPEIKALSTNSPRILDAMPETTNRNFTSPDELSAAHIAEPSQRRVLPTPAIGDYALIGDGHTAALISQQGSLDWLCLPHFSAPSIFGALLDKEEGGRFAICPQVPFRAQRQYMDSTNVLQTTFTTSDGVIRLTDMMTIAPADGALRPMREVLRIIEGIEGVVEVSIEVDPRPDYGRALPRAEFRESLGWTWSWGNELLWLTSDLVGISASGNSPGMRGIHRIRAGDRRFLSLGYAKGDIAVFAPLGSAATRRCEATVKWWSGWANQCRYEGPYRDAVRRSALTLKMLTHAISGAVVAAPTTSLPETIGGERNWDYRYCWLRDAALTMRAFTGLGYMDEARRFLDWLLHTTRLTWPELQIVYDIYGRPELPETELTHWRGHRESRPVRIGNAAQKQLQLDVYGNVLFAARNFAEAGGELRWTEARLLRGFGESVCRLWREPDNSMWEIRGQRRQYTFSKIMCWTALDSLIKLHSEGIVALRVAALERERSAIYGEIESRGFNSGLGS